MHEALGEATITITPVLVHWPGLKDATPNDQYLNDTKASPAWRSPWRGATTLAARPIVIYDRGTAEY